MNLSVSEQKNKIRRLHKNIRATLDIKNLSKIIMNKVLELPEFKKAENVCCYLPFGTETDTSLILNHAEKNILVPKISENEIFMTKYTPDNLQTGNFGISEPIDCFPVKLSKEDIIIVPALACDKNFYRIGYGKGYYDRYMKNTDAVKILPIPSKLLTDSLPHSEFDVQVDIIVTEKEVFKRT